MTSGGLLFRLYGLLRVYNALVRKDASRTPGRTPKGQVPRKSGSPFEGTSFALRCFAVTLVRRTAAQAVTASRAAGAEASAM